MLIFEGLGFFSTNYIQRETNDKICIDLIDTNQIHVKKEKYIQKKKHLNVFIFGCIVWISLC